MHTNCHQEILRSSIVVVPYWMFIVNPCFAKSIHPLVGNTYNNTSLLSRNICITKSIINLTLGHPVTVLWVFDVTRERQLGNHRMGHFYSFKWGHSSAIDSSGEHFHGTHNIFTYFTRPKRFIHIVPQMFIYYYHHCFIWYSFWKSESDHPVKWLA